MKTESNWCIFQSDLIIDSLLEFRRSEMARLACCNIEQLLEVSYIGYNPWRIILIVRVILSPTKCFIAMNHNEHVEALTISA